MQGYPQDSKARVLTTGKIPRRTPEPLVDVPPITLRAALAEPYVCPTCDEQACVCRIYDDPSGTAGAP